MNKTEQKEIFFPDPFLSFSGRVKSASDFCGKKHFTLIIWQRWVINVGVIVAINNTNGSN